MEDIPNEGFGFLNEYNRMDMDGGQGCDPRRAQSVNISGQSRQGGLVPEEKCNDQS